MKNLKTVLTGALLSAALVAPTVGFGRNWTDVCFTNESHKMAVKVVPQTTGFGPVVLAPGMSMQTKFYSIPTGTLFRVFTMDGSGKWVSSGSVGALADYPRVGYKVKPYFSGSSGVGPSPNRNVVITYGKCVK